MFDCDVTHRHRKLLHTLMLPCMGEDCKLPGDYRTGLCVEKEKYGCQILRRHNEGKRRWKGQHAPGEKVCESKRRRLSQNGLIKSIPTSVLEGSVAPDGNISQEQKNTLGHDPGRCVRTSREVLPKHNRSKPAKGFLTQEAVVLESTARTAITGASNKKNEPISPSASIWKRVGRLGHEKPHEHQCDDELMSSTHKRSRHSGSGKADLRDKLKAETNCPKPGSSTSPDVWSRLVTGTHSSDDAHSQTHMAGHNAPDAQDFTLHA